MLLDEFYFITDSMVRPNSMEATIEINKNHRIFEGHFPGQPIIPGACLFQIIKEMIELAVAGPVQLVKADHLKFLIPLDPNDTTPLKIDLKYNLAGPQHVHVSANVRKNNDMCFKFNGSFSLSA